MYPERVGVQHVMMLHYNLWQDMSTSPSASPVKIHAATRSTHIKKSCSRQGCQSSLFVCSSSRKDSRGTPTDAASCIKQESKDTRYCIRTGS